MKHLKLFNYMETDTANAMAVSIGTATIYFSYKTPVAFHDGQNFYARTNQWGKTTGRHIASLETSFGVSSNARLPGPEFEDKLTKFLEPLGITV